MALAALAASLAAEPGWHDRIRVDVDADLVVAGSPGDITEAVRRLVSHAAAPAVRGLGELEVACGLARGRGGKGGRVMVESRPGGGAAVGISFPAYRG